MESKPHKDEMHIPTTWTIEDAWILKHIGQNGFGNMLQKELIQYLNNQGNIMLIKVILGLKCSILFLQLSSFNFIFWECS
jgi:hypothetical protein